MKRELLMRYPQLQGCIEEIEQVKEEMIACCERGGKILLCGNGGSAADCEHISGELLKGFLKKRPVAREGNFANLDEEFLMNLQYGLPAISLPSLTAVNSAFANDVNPEFVYAQTVLALGREHDILIGISTSGNAANVCNAIKTANAIGMKTIALTGSSGGKLRELAKICIHAPEKETYKVQELHLPIYHYLCAMVEEHFYKI